MSRSRFQRRWQSFCDLPGIVRAGIYLVAAILLALLWPAEARADSEARQGADFVRLTARPCVHAAVLAAITAAGEDPDDYRAAVADLGGKSYAACWRPNFGARKVHLRYEDGDEGEVPYSELKPVKEA